MATIRVIRVDYEDQSRYHTDFQDFKEFSTEDFINFILSHRNYDFHIRALNAESEAAFGCLDIIAASGNPYVGVQLYLGKQGGARCLICTSCVACRPAASPHTFPNGPSWTTASFIVMKCAPPFESGSILTSTSPVLRTRSMATSSTPAAMRPIVVLTSGSTRPPCPLALLKGLNALQPLYTTFNMIIFEQMCTPLAVCLERNKVRKGFECVPEDTMLSMAKSYLLDMVALRQKAYTIDTRLPMIICRHTINDMY